MGSQEHNMVVLGQIVKHIPKKTYRKTEEPAQNSDEEFFCDESCHSHDIRPVKSCAESERYLRLSAISQGLPRSDSGLCSAEQEWSGSCERDPGCRTCGRIILGSIG